MPRRTHLLRGLALAVAAVLAVAASPVSAAEEAAEPAGDARVKVIVLYDDAPGRSARRAIERHDGTVRAKLPLVNGLAAELPRGQLRKLASERGVASVELDARLTMFDHGANTGDLEYENAWGVEHIGVPAVHASGIRGQGVRVAVIDTGIDYIHDDPDDVPYNVDPEFLGNYRGGYDFANGDDDPLDDNGHGTHVAGILAAEKNGYLVVGVAPAVDLYALKILDANGEGDVSNLILALQWALDHDIDVVNMSLGTHEVSPALASAVTSAHAQGLLMVAASGNVNPLSWQELFFGCPVAYPGAYSEVLSTTFTNGNDALTGFSCTGPEVDFAAPGNQIYSPVPVGTCMFCTPQGYAAQSGTSMASPHLAGTVALLLSAGIADGGGDPGVLDEVRDRLCTTADVGFGVNSTPIPPTDPRYRNYFGCGVLNADGAVLGLNPPDNRPPVATDDAAITTEDTPVSIAVLSNDSDPDGDPLTVVEVGSASHGTATIESGATSIQYVPSPDFAGDDTFTYTVSDGRGGTDSASVAVSVAAVDDPPTADPKTAEVTAPASVSIGLSGSDPDTCELAFEVVDLPDHGGIGSLVHHACTPGSPNRDGASVTYTPSSGYAGPDSFTYRVRDASSASPAVTVSITVTGAPPPSTTIHVGDLDGGSLTAGKTWTARVTIRVHDAGEAGVGGVVVTGRWAAGASGNASCTTAADGSCTVEKGRIKTSAGSVGFNVTSLALAGFTYDPAANHDPDGDSTGTSIAVARPN